MNTLPTLTALALGLLALLGASLWALGIGPVDVSSAWPLAADGAEPDPTAAAVLWSLRAPRVAMAILAGAVLAAGGCVMQTLFRNPLAEPGLLGLSSGAALGASLALVLALEFGRYAGAVVPLSAFGGALLVATLVTRLAAGTGGPRVASMLLAGLAINAIAGAGIGLLATIADDAALRGITFWLFGSVGKAPWPAIATATVPILAALLIPMALARRMNVLMLGEAEAFHLGVNVAALKRWLLLSVILGVGTAVSLTGIIGFVGLIVPHAVRLLVGHDNRAVLAVSALWGAVLLVSADAIGRALLYPAELPVGIVTALLGGPFFLALLARRPDALADR